MKKIDSATFRKLINDAEIAFMGIPTKESLTYMPYGSKIRDNIYGKAMELLNNGGYEKVILSDLVNPATLSEIDKVSKVSGGYMKIENKDLMIAAGHEINAYIYIKELLKHHYDSIDLPIRIYNFGPVFRTNKNTKFPFNLGERKSFLECYAVFKTKEEAEKELSFAINWNRTIIRDLLHIPSVEVIRPIATNKKISKKTICIDSITPLDETVITGMTYFHDDIFTRAINLKYKDQTINKNKLTFSTHFGLSENILFSYLLNSCDGKNLRLYSFIAPTQVSLINTIGPDFDSQIYAFSELLKKKNVRHNIEVIPRKKINSVIVKNTMKGIPVSIIFKRESNKIGIYFSHGGNQELKTIIEDNSNNLSCLLSDIYDILEKNDQEIMYDMTLRETNSIICCNDIYELADIVKKGKIAKIYLENTDDKVHEVETYLDGGEILGFALNEELGEDIITKKRVRTVAYASRRS